LRSKIYDFQGILLIDKPIDWSSNAVLQKVKKILSVDKAGHTGSLDPLATGMLPLCLGEATKFAQYGINADKHYRVIAKFGEQTTTSDAHGIIKKIRAMNFTDYELKVGLQSFEGKLKQVPSIFSAVKYKGIPLYKYARHNIKIPILRRDIFVYNIQYIAKIKNFIELEIKCSKGTYIRTIIDNLGETLGCGAHVTYLRRLQVGSYPKCKMISLHNLLILNKMSNISFKNIVSSLLMPIDALVDYLPEIIVSNFLASCLKKGQIVFFSLIMKNILVRILDEKKNFIGLGEIDHKGYLKPKRLLSVKKINNKNIL